MDSARSDNENRGINISRFPTITKNPLMLHKGRVNLDKWEQSLKNDKTLENSAITIKVIFMPLF